MKTIIHVFKYINRKTNAKRIGAYSAQTAFFMFLSLIPLLILILSFFNQIGSSVEIITKFADNFTPNVVNSFFEVYFDEIAVESNKTLTIVSAFLLLWSASKGIFSIIGGLNSVYEIKESRNYFLLRITAMFYTFAFILVLISTASILLFGDKIFSMCIMMFPNVKKFIFISSSLRYIFAFLILALFFSMIYKFLPNEKMKFTEQMPGAIISSTGWICFSIGFSLFVDKYSNFANIYGSLATIIVLMLWLYICMYILFFGALINVVLANK